MASQALGADSAHANLAPALRELEKRASEYETVIRQTRAALTALFHADLISRQPAKGGTLDQEDSASLLLDLIADRLTRLDGPDELELSSRLGILAYQLEQEVGARG